jgi:hypothetical protein
MKLWIKTPDYQKGVYTNRDFVVSGEEISLMKERWLRSSKSIKSLLDKW